MEISKNKDWCSKFPDRVFSILKMRMVYIGNQCRLHDARYGSLIKSRWTADLELFNDVKRKGLPLIATIMFIGVRLFGSNRYKLINK